MSWKKLRTKKIFEHPRMALYEDVVELPNGKQTTYLHYGQHRNGAMVIAIKDGKILLQKEYNYPPDVWLYQLPGGTIEDGESAQAGALRELAEEARLRGTLHLLGWYYMNNRRAASKHYVFVAENVKKDESKARDMEEEFEDFWYTPEEISNLIADGKIVNPTLLAAWALFINSRYFPQ